MKKADISGMYDQSTLQAETGRRRAATRLLLSNRNIVVMGGGGEAREAVPPGLLSSSGRFLQGEGQRGVCLRGGFWGAAEMGREVCHGEVCNEGVGEGIIAAPGYIPPGMLGVQRGHGVLRAVSVTGRHRTRAKEAQMGL